MAKTKGVKTVKCKQCGKHFEVKNWTAGLAKFCSYKCSNKGRTTKKSVKKTRTCIGCGADYLPTNWNQKWCSRDCFRKNGRCWFLSGATKQDVIDRSRAVTGPKSYPKECPSCKKDFQASRKNQKFCSRWCAARGRHPGKRKKKPKGTWSLDNLWAKAVKIRAGDRCEYCGKITTLNSHHIFSRSNMATRWDVNNGVCLCVSHHVFGKMSAHKAPIEFVEWLKEKRGELWYEQLRAKAKKTEQQVGLDKEQIKQELKEIVG
jgi:hypothetical protein